MKKRKLLFAANDLVMGGIEKALITMLSAIDYKKYDVTLLLQSKSGILLDKVPKEVIIKQCIPSNNSSKIIRKIINNIKLIKRIISNYRKYDFSCSFAPYCILNSIIVRYASKNNYLWLHSNYYDLFQKNIIDFKYFFNHIQIKKFNNIVFVANEAKDSFLKIYPKLRKKTHVCGNMIDYENIQKLAAEKIKKIKPDRPLFLTISRHEEKSKKITRLIEASRLLRDAGYNFEVWILGSGPDSTLYIDLIDEYELHDNVKMLGFKQNPYPYYEKTDVFILTSDYEGFPIVYLEALLFKLPIITTIDVSTDFFKMSDGYATIAEKNEISVYECMKMYLDKQCKNKRKLDIKKYNNEIMTKLEKYFEKDNL
jgi:glycosyltransferase involved in cell wall biosynthesis